MNATARDFNSQPADTNGLEDIFDEGLPQGLPVFEVGVLDSSQGLPVEEAALKLGMSERAVLKRLRRGTLRGFKQKVKRGEKWFVSLESLEADQVEGLPQGLPVEVEGLPVFEVGVLDSSQGLPGGLPPETDHLMGLVQDLQTKLDKANEQLQAASFRNGYLESKLEDREVEIKLLTDSQHKGGWWARLLNRIRIN